MKFSEIDSGIQNSLDGIFSSFTRGEEIKKKFAEFDIAPSSWQQLADVLKKLDRDKLNVLLESFLSDVVFADVPPGGGSTEILLKRAVISLLLGAQPQRILFLVSLGSQIDSAREKMLALAPGAREQIGKVSFFTTSSFLQKVLTARVGDESVLVHLGMTDDFKYSSQWMDILSESRNTVNRGIPFWMILRRKFSGESSFIPEKLRPPVEEIFRTYEVSLEEHKIFDRIATSKMVKRFHLNAPDVFKERFAKYDYVLIDGGQKYDSGEWEILQLFSAEGKMLACGDFSGAYYKPSEIRLEKEISSFELNRLFRHGPVITEALSNFSARKISAETAGEEAGFIYYEATDEEDELNFISFEIKHLISQGLAPPKIGVIYKDLEFPGNFRQTASTFGLSVLDYPGTGVIVPFIPRVVKILQDNETVDTMSVLEKNLSPDEFRRTRRWFELRMKKFAPYVTGTDRNRRLVENLKGIGAREEDSVKLVVEHFAESYQFDVVFIPSFDGWNFPESLRGTVNAMISRASKGVFLTRPLKRPPKFKWQKPFLTSPSPLIRFFPVKTLKGSGSGTLKKILSKIF
ncbi:MAG: hypothetical protein ABIJ15_07330 [bacterium]